MNIRNIAAEKPGRAMPAKKAPAKSAYRRALSPAVGLWGGAFFHISKQRRSST
jgi:hypothetical protein